MASVVVVVVVVLVAVVVVVVVVVAVVVVAVVVVAVVVVVVCLQPTRQPTTDTIPGNRVHVRAADCQSGIAPQHRTMCACYA